MRISVRVVRLSALLLSASLPIAALAHVARAGSITTVDAMKATANGMLDITSDFTFDTGTVGKPTMSFMFMGMNLTGRIVMQNGGPPVVVYDLGTLKIAAGKTLTVTGELPVGFLTLDDAGTEFDILIEGTLSVSADGRTPGAGGGAGGAGGTVGRDTPRDGKNATGTTTGAGKTGTGTGGGAGGGGGYGGEGGKGAIGATGRGNRTGGDGGAVYGDAKVKPLLGGGGGAGSSSPVGERSGAGGGGGGGLLLNTKGKIKIAGRVEADGGAGADADPAPGLAGGGGAGGSILLEALDGACGPNSIVFEGTGRRGRLSARGGRGGADSVIASGGGGGGGGRVFLSDCLADLARVDVRGGSGGFFGRDSDPQGQAGGKGSASRAEAIPAPPALCLVGFGLVALWASKRPRFRPISRRGTVRRSPAGRPARSA